MEEHAKYNTKTELSGKLQPQAVDLEEIILGAIMLESDSITKVINILNPECFYKKTHKLIFTACINLLNNQSPIDILTVTNELKSNGELEFVGGAYFICTLTNRIASSVNIEYYASIVYQKYLQREIITLCSGIQTKAYTDEADIFEIINDTQDSLLSYVRFDVSKITTIKDAVKQVFNTIEHNLKFTNTLTGIGTGFTEFDNFTSGLQKGDLVIVAGETSQGKTAFALTMLKNATMLFGKAAVIYSLEMTQQQLATRLISSESGINSAAISMHRLSNDSISKINQVTERVINANIYFDDSSTSSIDTICNSIRTMTLKYNIDLVMIDYLQLITNNRIKASKEERTAEIARRLKNTAKELNVCVILLSQLSRTQGSPKPTMNRLRDSGQIEEAADMVILVYRPEFYNTTLPSPFEDINPIGKAFIDITKGRNTGIKSFLLDFHKETTTFNNCETLDQQDYNKPLSF